MNCALASLLTRHDFGNYSISHGLEIQPLFFVGDGVFESDIKRWQLESYNSEKRVTKRKVCGLVRFAGRHGARKEDYARRNYFDVWLPELAPSTPLVSWALADSFTPKRWATYERKYLAEIRNAPAQRLIALLAGLSLHADFSIGCYCADESRCHRSILKRLLAERGAKMA